MHALPELLPAVRYVGIGASSALLVISGSSVPSADASLTRVRATDRSMAAAVLSHFDTARTPGLIGPLHGPGNGVANAEVRYGVNGESPNPGRTIDTIVAVYRHRRPDVTLAFCRSQEGQNEDGCRVRTLRNGSHLILFWERFTPEEDPGGVGFIRLDTGQPWSAVFFSGPPIKGDPSKLGLSNRTVSFQELRDVAKDPRLSWRTTRNLVKAGAKLRHWGDDQRP